MLLASDFLRELYMHADALRLRADSHTENRPGDSYVERLMADHVEKLADQLGAFLTQPSPHMPSRPGAGS